MKEYFTFDDVLLVPQRSGVFSRKDVHTTTKFSSHIALAAPIVSANMDTVTESRMALAIARAGGIGVIHRFMPIARQAKEVARVKEKGASMVVAAAVGVKDDTMERARALVEAGADALVVDIAHGHNERALETVKLLKKKFLNIDIVGGNVATARGVVDLIKAGADAVKVGIGPGAACTTRVVTGVGVPQLSAIVECARAAQKYNIPIIADGGIRNSGDMCKALAAGASTVMIGSLFAGTDEAPGEHIMQNGSRYKRYRGMASHGAVVSTDGFYRSPEGKSGVVPYQGPVRVVADDLVSGLRSSMSYMGAHTLVQFHKNAEFIRVSHSTLKESSSRI